MAALALGGAIQHAAEGVDTGDAVQRLIERYLAAQTSAERVTYMRALGNTADIRVMETVTLAVMDKIAAVRLAAIGALRFMPTERADELLKIFVQTADEASRLAALESVTHRTLTDWIPTLIERLQNDTSERVRKNVVQLLSRVVSNNSVAAALARCAQGDASPDVRNAAAAALDGS